MNELTSLVITREMCVTGIGDEVPDVVYGQGGRAILKGGHIRLVSEVVVSLLIKRHYQRQTRYSSIADDLEVEGNCHVVI